LGEQDAAAAAEQLVREGRPAEALALIAPLAAAEAPSHRILFVQSSALKTLGRHDAALQANRKAVALYPASGVAWHNLAATLGDLGRADEAKAAAEKAFALRLDAPETWLVYARALHALCEFDAAEKAFRRVLGARPAGLHAAVELSRLIWMSRGDAEAAVEVLEAAMRAGAPEAPILLAIDRILAAAGAEARTRAARLEAALQRGPDDVTLLRAAAQAALEAGDEDRGEALAARAEALAPDDVGAKIQHASLLLAQGRAQAALSLARRATELAPNDQAAWGWLATAARAAGDPAYRWLCDYEAFVRAYDVDAPAGWPDVEHWLADLRSALRRLHRLSFQPPELTLRGGVQTTVELTQVADPAIRGFFAAIETPIRAYASALGDDRSHPLTRRKMLQYRVSGSWSVLLKPHGFHVDHFHPLGWLSSAFYVEVPDAVVDSRDREGWIRFGQPPFKTVPAMGPERYVQPRPGRLVLFPSYMWHGTVPFTAPENRLTIAFDVVPAAE
jgi:tetratricopeptide (TPR) repeat protein